MDLIGCMCPAVACLGKTLHKLLTPIKFETMSKQELEYRALKLVEKCPTITQRQLSKELGVSLGKAHYVLKALVEVGWIKLENFQRSNNKFGYAYLLTPKGVVEKAKITRRFLLRKQQEYEQLKREIEQLQVEVDEF